MARFIIACISMFAVDSNPPVASMRPSPLNATDRWPIVPEDIMPKTFVIMAEMSFIFGMPGI